MRTLAPSRSITTYWEDLVYVEAALLASDETAPLAAAVSAMLETFATVSQRDLDTRRALIQSRARSSVADTNLDDTIREVHANTLHLVRQDRGRKEYTTLFPGALTALIRHALANQIIAAREFIQRLGLSLFEPSFRDAQVAMLEPKIAKGEAVLEERRDAEIDRVEGRIEIETWKEEANAVRMSVYAGLLEIAAKTKRKRSWAETFFPTTSARSTRDDGEAEGDEVEIEPDSL
jgi:hypothetical protein